MMKIPNQEYWLKRNKLRISPYWKKADNLEKRTIKEFTNAYKELEKELYTFVGKYGKDNKLTYSQARVIALMKKIKPHIDKLYTNQQLSLTDTFMDILKDNYFKGLYQMSTSLNVAANFAAIDEKTIKAILQYPYGGVSFSDDLWNNKDYLILNIKKTLTDGIIRGESINEMAKNLLQVKKADGKTVYTGSIGQAINSSRRIIATEVGVVLSKSDEEMYKEFGVEQYEYVATLDDRTSTICQGLDGQIFNLDEYTIGVNAPPMHPRCRSTTIPYISENYGKRIAKKSSKYEYVPSNITYEEWYDNYID